MSRRPQRRQLMSLQLGFERLLGPEVTPHDACERIEKAWHEKQLQLYCNGILLEPSAIKALLRLVAEQGPDGCWLCTVLFFGLVRGQVIEADDSDSVQRVTMAIPPPPVWKVDVEGIEKLRGGVRSVERWTEVVDNELRRLQDNDSPLLRRETEQELYGHLTLCVKERTGAPPPYPKRLRRRVRDRLGVGVQKS